MQVLWFLTCHNLPVGQLFMVTFWRLSKMSKYLSFNYITGVGRHLIKLNTYSAPYACQCKHLIKFKFLSLVDDDLHQEQGDDELGWCGVTLLLRAHIVKYTSHPLNVYIILPNVVNVKCHHGTSLNDYELIMLHVL